MTLRLAWALLHCVRGTRRCGDGVLNNALLPMCARTDLKTAFNSMPRRSVLCVVALTAGVHHALASQTSHHCLSCVAMLNLVGAFTEVSDSCHSHSFTLASCVQTSHTLHALCSSAVHSAKVSQSTLSGQEWHCCMPPCHCIPLLAL